MKPELGHEPKTMRKFEKRARKALRWTTGFVVPLSTHRLNPSLKSSPAISLPPPLPLLSLFIVCSDS